MITSIMCIPRKYDLNHRNGGQPFGDLIEAPNNKIYGMTSGGVIGNLVHYLNMITLTIFIRRKLILSEELQVISHRVVSNCIKWKMYGMNSEGG